MRVLSRAALYIRVSTDEQTEYSPTAQKKSLIDYAEKNNMTVLPENIFIDEGFSGRKAEKRPAFMKMIGLAKRKPYPFDVILVHKFDRFSRNREDSIVYKSMLKKECSIRVISITESLDEDDKMSILIEAILEAMAEYYSINLSEEVKKGMTEKARQGGYQTSPPLGYRAGTRNTLEILTDEARHIKLIFEQYVEQGKSPYQIAKSMNEAGLRTKRGNALDSRGIEYILRNPVYIGMLRWTPTEKAKRNFDHPDTIITRGQHEPIVSEDIFHAAEKKLSASSKHIKPANRPSNEYRHWLSGLVKCSACGTSLVVSSASNPPSFQCGGYTHARCDVSHSISISKLEATLITLLKKVFYDMTDIKYTTHASQLIPLQKEQEKLEKQLLKAKDKLNRAKEAYLSEIDSLSEYRESKQALTSQIQLLTQDLNVLTSIPSAPIPNKPEDIFYNVTDILTSDNSIDMKRAAVTSFIEKIIYRKKNSLIEIYFYDI